jgi:hypothetical protein
VATDAEMLVLSAIPPFEAGSLPLSSLKNGQCSGQSGEDRHYLCLMGGAGRMASRCAPSVLSRPELCSEPGFHCSCSALVAAYLGIGPLDR